MADSMWLSIPSSILIPLKTEFNLPPSSASAVASCLVSGMIFGSIAFGLLADKYGRVPCFYLSCILPPVFGIVSALSNSFILICVCFVFIGIGVGGNVPVDSSLFLESMASKYQYLLVWLTVSFLSCNRQDILGFCGSFWDLVGMDDHTKKLLLF